MKKNKKPRSVRTRRTRAKRTRRLYWTITKVKLWVLEMKDKCARKKENDNEQQEEKMMNKNESMKSKRKIW